MIFICPVHSPSLEGVQMFTDLPVTDDQFLHEQDAYAPDAVAKLEAALAAYDAEIERVATDHDRQLADAQKEMPVGLGVLVSMGSLLVCSGSMTQTTIAMAMIAVEILLLVYLLQKRRQIDLQRTTLYAAQEGSLADARLASQRDEWDALRRNAP